MDRQDPTEDPLTSPERVNYYKGEMLTADDLRAEQRYFIGKERRHNCCVHRQWGREAAALTQAALP